MYIETTTTKTEASNDRRQVQQLALKYVRLNHTATNCERRTNNRRTRWSHARIWRSPCPCGLRNGGKSFNKA
ncbi:unnamed protein product [Ceratitis capitata]|uniref:(Mediterranean fruit fly) hypothetical protein n=1 Tax=Ceratitis capitata TaxID=7213 RepID=A0A811UPI2_CERCA|nr:unnamed protein product [Ceratitis capitata]